MQALGDGVFCFEGYTLDRRQRCLRRGDREIALRPKSFDLLCCLVENADRALSKDDIIAIVWRGIAATDESVARCVSDVRLALGDAAQRIIRTVPGHGYQFTAPIALSRAASLLVPADAAWVEMPRLSAVILPFVKLGGPIPDYFADALTDSLTIDFARIPDAFVIGGSTTFGYKGKAVDARQVGRELGVRYLVAGSVLGARDRVRVHVRLIDAATGGDLWADRVDEPHADLLAMQDRITARLVRALGIALVAIESRRVDGKGRAAMDSRDLALRGRAILNGQQSSDTMRTARDWFEEALRLDGNNLDALLGLAWTHFYEISNWLSERPAEQTQAAEAAMTRAVALAPGKVDVHFMRASIFQVTQSPEVALRGYERVVELDRAHAPSHAAAGITKLYLGRAHETESHVSEAMRLSPQDPRSNVWHSYAGVADFFLGRVDPAIDRLRKALDLNPRRELDYFYLATALAETGQAREHAAVLEAGRRLAPNFSIGKYLSESRSDHPVYVAQRARIVEAMRKAGIPN
jgi:TolB-like protein/DNA-binding winged helix-turn-helix (wHTH) protein